MGLDKKADAASRLWHEYPAEQWSDAIVAAMKTGGIDHLFFTSGSEIGFYQESIAKAEALGRLAPRLVTMMHEGVALNAATGSAMVSGKPAATAAHVDVGLLNKGAGLHTAWKGSYPILMTSGTGPRAYPGTMTGGRDHPIQWYQEPRDQGEIVRQYTKIDHRLESQDNPGLMISRLLQVSVSEPKGPVYLALPREVVLTPVPGGIARFPTRDQLGVARPAWPDPDDAKRIAGWLIKADNPCIYTSNSGRNPGSVAELVRLAELLAVPVMQDRLASALTFPRSHALFGTGPSPKEADALLVMESPVPWMPPNESPSPDAKVAFVDVDPVMSRFKTTAWQADLWLPVDTASAARAIYEAATGLLDKGDLTRIAVRRAHLEEKKRAQMAQAQDMALRAGQRRPIHPLWVSYQIGQLLEPGAILLDDAISNSDSVMNYSNRNEPGTFFKVGSSSGGWGAGAAFGAKLAKPDRDIVLATGDGYFMFDNPIAALWSAAHHKAAFLTVVYVNRSYSTGTTVLRKTYPEGYVAKEGKYAGGMFDPPPDYAKIAEAANGYGENVRESEDLVPALKRGLDAVRNGTPAVIGVWLPTLIEESTLG